MAPVTEIPEHLLKRSRERRAQLKGGSADSGDAASSGDEPASTPAKAADTAPAAAAPSGPPTRAAAQEPAAPPPPKPDTPVVAAAKARRRVPFWAMAALSLMPLWAFMYLRALTDSGEGPAGPLGEGAEVYNGCASCHGATGAGGSGRELDKGEVLKTFPRIEDQLRWVELGSDAYSQAGVKVYGDPGREGGAHEVYSFNGTAMPPQGEEHGGLLTDAEILAVVCHERYTIGGADPAGEYEDEYALWCADSSPLFAGLDAGEYTFLDMDQNATDADGKKVDMLAIGEEPVEGSGPAK